MGYNFAYDLWVPRERLEQTALAVAARESTERSSPLIWPFGKPSPVAGASAPMERLRGEVEYYPTFWFALDETLREYNEDEMRRVREHNAEMLAPYLPPRFLWAKLWARLRGHAPQPPSPLPDEVREQLYDEKTCDYEREGGLDLWLDVTADEESEGREWLDGERDLVRVRFQAPDKSLSHVICNSDSVRAFFFDLAREVGAYACVFDYEWAAQLIYLEGDELNIPLGENEFGSPFGLAILAGRPASANARRMNEMGLLRWNDLDFSGAQGRELLAATRDENSGIRAQALRALAYEDEPRAVEAVVGALADSDARVRETAVAVYASRARKELEMAPMLRLIETDAAPAVRLRAIRALGEFPASTETLRALVSRAPTPENLATIEAAFFAIRVLHARFGDGASAALLREIAEWPDLLFRRQAQESLEANAA